MAKQPFSYGPYRLSWLHGEACAVTGSRPEGNFHRYRLGVYTEEEGRAALVSLATGEERVEVRSVGTVEALWVSYYEDRKKDGKVMRAFDCAWRNLGPFFGSMLARDVNKDTCRAYAKLRFETGKGRKGKRVSNDTVWTELIKLSSCFGWAKENNMIDRVPPTWLPARSVRSEEVLTPDEVLRLMEACNFSAHSKTRGTYEVEHEHLRLFIVLMMCTGGRPTAVLELVGKRCLFDHRLIDLRTPEDDDPMSKAFKKGRALVHMNNLALTALMQARARIEADGGNWDDAHVIQWRGQGIDRINKSFLAAVVRAGLPGWVSPHKLRHAVATWIDEAGIDIEFTSELLGHKHGSRVTKEVYVHRKGTKTKDATGVIDKALGGQRLRIAK